MLDFIRILLKPLYSLWGQDYQIEAERYVSNRNPKSSGDADFWLRDYERRTQTERKYQ
jgi:hypothetical protein